MELKKERSDAQSTRQKLELYERERQTTTRETADLHDEVERLNSAIEALRVESEGLKDDLEVCGEPFD